MNNNSRGRNTPRLVWTTPTEKRRHRRRVDLFGNDCAEVLQNIFNIINASTTKILITLRLPIENVYNDI